MDLKIQILEKELKLKKLQEEILQNEIELLKLKEGKSPEENAKILIQQFGRGSKDKEIYLGPQTKKGRTEFQEEERIKIQSLSHAKLATPYEVTKVIMRKNQTLLTRETWYRELNALRTNGVKSYTEERIMPVHEKGYTSAIIFAGASPERVFRLFNLGLIKTIYPGNKLEELDHFPPILKKVIQNYQINTRSQHKNLFFKITSSIPDWKEDGRIRFPYHYIRMGISNNESNVMTPEERSPLEEDEDLEATIRAERLGVIYTTSHGINADTHIKINYFNNTTLITTWSNKVIADKEKAHVDSWNQKFAAVSLDIGNKTKEKFIELMEFQPDEVMADEN